MVWGRSGVKPVFGWVCVVMLLGAAGFGLAVGLSSGEERGSASSHVPVRERDMVFVPGGRLMLGANGVYADEGPVQAVTVKPFRISRTEVTNAQFAEFVVVTGYQTVAERQPDPAQYPDIPPELLKPGSSLFVQPTDISGGGNFLKWWQFVEGASWRRPEGPGSSIEGREHYPVVHIAFEDAQAYAAWKGQRLPTEAEFEYAARGGLRDARYAWGDELVPEGNYKANTWQGLFPVQNTEEDGYQGLAPVGGYEPNPYGIHDLIGNVWEWTATLYYPSHKASGNASEQGYDPSQPGLEVRVIKGGSFLCAPNYCQRYRPAARHAQDIGLGAGHIGFRTVQDAN